jgi:hypothetical protein
MDQAAENLAALRWTTRAEPITARGESAHIAHGLNHGARMA